LIFVGFFLIIKLSMHKPKTELEEKVIKLYLNGSSSGEISKSLPVPRSTVLYILGKYKIKMRSLSQSHQKYKYDSAFFKKINSYIKAQIFGLIMADGCVAKNRNNKVLTISLLSCDKNYLTAIRDNLNYTGPLYTMNRDGGDYLKTLRIVSPSYFDNLSSLGCIPRKSLVLKFPTRRLLDYKYISSFILGYFEGDGGLTICKNQATLTFAGTFDFLQEVKNILYKECKIHFVLYQNKKKNKKLTNTWTLGCGGNRQVLKALTFLYKDAQIKMTRKYKKFLLIKRNIEKVDQKYGNRYKKAKYNHNL